MVKKFTYKEIDYLKSSRQFIDAWQSAFKRDINQNIFNWIFGPGSNNHLYVAFCEEDGKIAGGYCLLEQEAIVNNQICTSYLCNNVFTVPEYRGHKVFVQLGEYALAQVQGGKNVALGFPNDLSVPGHKRVGWSDCQPVVFFEKTSLKVILNNVFSLDDVCEDDLIKIETLWRDNVMKSSFCIVKNKNYFKWRYLERPQFKRKYFVKIARKNDDLIGYIVLSHYFENNQVHIVDIMAKTYEGYSFLILNACDLANDLNASSINVWGSAVTQPFFIEHGFSPTEKQTKLIVKDLSVLKNRNLLESVKFNNFVLGDNDVF